MDIREIGLGGCGLDSTGSGQGPVAGCCECGDEPSGYCAPELVIYAYYIIMISCLFVCLSPVNFTNNWRIKIIAFWDISHNRWTITESVWVTLCRRLPHLGTFLTALC
jgi:hypothetical protein